MRQDGASNPRTRRMRKRLVAFLTIALAGAAVGAARAEGPQRRIALVVGNSAYEAAPLETPANDAALVAQALREAGFEVEGARDMGEADLRRSLRRFVDKAAQAGPDAVAFVYLAGYGVQYEGENYFAPVDARPGSPADVPSMTLRLSDTLRRLDALPMKARIVVLDAARAVPFARGGGGLAPGLGLVEAAEGSLVAYNAAPGTVAPEGRGPYGAYARALVEMLRQGGLASDEVFDRVRLRVAEETKGAGVPWEASRLQGDLVLVPRAPGSPEPVGADVSDLRYRPMWELDSRQAFAATLQRDTVQAYEEFLTIFPDDPLARRVRALLAARREAATWREARLADRPQSYWTYLARYPRGAHAKEARRRLSALGVPREPAPGFAEAEFGVAPPAPGELAYAGDPSPYLTDPSLGVPPAPDDYLPRQSLDILTVTSSGLPVGGYAQPEPVYVPYPVYVGGGQGGHWHPRPPYDGGGRPGMGHGHPGHPRPGHPGNGHPGHGQPGDGGPATGQPGQGTPTAGSPPPRPVGVVTLPPALPRRDPPAIPVGRPPVPVAPPVAAAPAKPVAPLPTPVAVGRPPDMRYQVPAAAPVPDPAAEARAQAMREEAARRAAAEQAVRQQREAERNMVMTGQAPVGQWQSGGVPVGMGMARPAVPVQAVPQYRPAGPDPATLAEQAAAQQRALAEHQARQAQQVQQAQQAAAQQRMQAEQAAAQQRAVAEQEARRRQAMEQAAAQQRALEEQARRQPPPNVPPPQQQMPQPVPQPTPVAAPPSPGAQACGRPGLPPCRATMR